MKPPAPIEDRRSCACCHRPAPPSGVRGGRSGALKNVQGHVVSRDTWCPRRAVRERRRPSQDSWPSWDSTVLGQRKCPGTKRGVLGQPTPSQDGDCPGHRVSRDTFASRTPFASQDIPPDPQMEVPCPRTPNFLMYCRKHCYQHWPDRQHWPRPGSPPGPGRIPYLFPFGRFFDIVFPCGANRPRRAGNPR